jgi:type IV pilus assembly protein PilQ
MDKIYIFICRVLNLFAIIFLLFFIIPYDTNAQEPKSVSMDFQEAALKDVLKVFSQQAGLNFVATENIENRNITVYMDNVTVSDALNSIMTANNLTFEQAQDSSVFIVKATGKSPIKLITRVYFLDFARIMPRPAMAGEGEGQQGPPVISGVSELVPILYNQISRGVDGEAQGSIIFDQRTNSLIISAIEEDFPVIEEIINKLDSPIPQALIEAEIVEIQTGALKALGLEWGGGDGTFVRFTGPTKVTHFPFTRSHNPFSKGLLSVDSGDSESTSSQENTLGVLSLQEFSMVIKALESEGKARYLAKPRIMTQSNSPAIIRISADSVIGVKKTSVPDTREIIEEAERSETGITLGVIPTVNSKGYITMSISPEISRVVRSTYFPAFADPATRSARTTVMVKDGQTIAIAGLLKTEEDDEGRDVPGLSKIPLFGNLFRSKSRRTTQTEIIIFITAHAILEKDDMIKTANALQDHQAEIPHPDEMAASDAREAEIQKTVMKLRRKRELERNR